MSEQSTEIEYRGCRIKPFRNGSKWHVRIGWDTGGKSIVYASEPSEHDAIAHGREVIAERSRYLHQQTGE